MNKMNGGYVMVKYDATQTELKNAYETKRPVIMYDADNVGHYAKITLVGTTYVVNEIGGSNLYLYQITGGSTLDLGGGTIKKSPFWASVISPTNYEIDEDTDLNELVFNLIDEQSDEDSGKFIVCAGQCGDADYVVTSLVYFDNEGETGFNARYLVEDIVGTEVIAISGVYKREL